MQEIKKLPHDKGALLHSLENKRKALFRQFSETAESDEQRRELILAELRLLNRTALPLHRASQSDYDKSVFISYARDTEGKERYALARHEFGQRNYELRNKFEVRTGFERQRELLILQNIADLIMRSTVFLGIWTLSDDDLKNNRTECAPAHWLPLELGMAIAFQKPFRLVVDKRIDDSWYLKPMRGVIHTVVEGDKFADAIEDARIALDQRIDEQLFFLSSEPVDAGR